MTTTSRRGPRHELLAAVLLCTAGASCGTTRNPLASTSPAVIDSGHEGASAIDSGLEGASVIDSGHEGGATADRVDGSSSCGAVTSVRVGAAGTAHGLGTVTAVTAITPVACLGGHYLNDGIEKGFGFFFDDGASLSHLSVGLPWNRPLLRVGQKVSVEANDSDCAGSYQRYVSSDVVIRDEHGTLLVWIVWNGRTTVTPPPEVSIEHGPPRCATTDSCATLESPRLSMSIGGTKVALDPGATQIGDYVAIYDGFPDVTPTTGDTCNVADWYVQSAGLGVIRGNLAELSAPRRCGSGPCAASEYCELPAGADCSAMETDGVCKPRPASCPTACDPVSTCDGYACNECIAKHRGQTVTNDALCAATGTWDRPSGEPSGSCTERLTCTVDPGLASILGDGPNYEMRCATGDGGSAECECVRNGSISKTVHLEALPSCTPEDAISVCGFTALDGRRAGADAGP